MGLTFVTREDGSTGYEYLDEDQMRERGSNAAILPTLHGDAQEQLKGVAGALRADKDDNFFVGAGKTALRMPVNMMAGAIQETSDSARYLGEATGLLEPGTSTTQEEPDKPVFGNWKPVKANNQEAWLSGVEDFGTGVGQFALEWIALSKVLKGANWALKTSKVPALVKASKGFSKVAQADKAVSQAVTKGLTPIAGKTLARGGGFVAAQTVRSTVEPKGLAIDFAGFDPWEGNLITMAANSEIGGWLKGFPVAKELIFDPDDTETERRFKQLAEGWGVDWAFGGLLKGAEASLSKFFPDLLAGVTKATGYTEQLAEATRTFGAESPEVKAIQAKIEKQAELLEKNPLLKYLEGQSYQAPELPLPKALEQADKNQPLSLFLRTAAFEDQAFIAIHRLEEAMNKFVAPDRGGKPRQPLDTVGDLVNLLNVARVATEEGVQKALRDVNNLLLPPDQRPERELLIGVQGWRKRMEAGKLATNRQVTQMLGEQPTVPSTKQIPEGPPTQNVVPTPPAATEIPPTPVTKTPTTPQQTVPQQYASKEYRNAIAQLTAELEALGPAPTKPGKGKSYYQAPGELKKTQTPAYKKYMKWQREAKPITDKINKLIKANQAEIRANQKKVDAPVETKLNPEEFQTKIESTSSKKRPDARYQDPKTGKFLTWNPYEAGWFDDVSDLSRRGYGAWDETLSKQGGNKREIEQTLGFMDKLGREMFQDIAPQVLANLPKKGRYDFLRKVVLIQKEAIKNNELKRTAIHELWHTLSRFIPKAELKQLTSEFNWERTKYLNKIPKPELEAFKRGEYTEANYRYANIDEYFTETMLDLWMAYDKMPVPPRGSLQAIAETVRNFFNQILNNIRAELGLNATQKIFNNFINQRYSKIYRNKKLEFDSIGKDAPKSPDDFMADLPDFRKDREVDGDPNRPGETGTNYKITEQMLDNFRENLEKVQRGELDLEEAYGYAMQDVINIQSAGKNKTLYMQRDQNLELYLKAASDLLDRQSATDMPSINLDQMRSEVLRDLDMFGLSLDQVDNATKVFRYIAANNPKYVRSVMELRIAVNRLGKIAGTKAANVMNAMNNGTINWNKAVKELEVSTVEALHYFREYQKITRMLAQNFRALQVKFGSEIDDINLIQKGEKLPVYKENIEQNIIERGKTNDINFGSLFGEEVREAMATGKWGPGAKSQVNQIANSISDSAYRSGEGIGHIDKQIKGPHYEDGLDVDPSKQDEIGGGTLKSKSKIMQKVELFGRSTATHKVSGILSAGGTYAVQSSIPYARLLTEPALDLFNQSVLVQKGSNLLPVDIDGGLQKLPMTGIWYKQIFLEHWGALKLAAKAFRDGQTYFDAFRHPGSFDTHTNQTVAAAVRQAEGGQPIKLPNKRGAFNLNEAEAMRAMTDNPAAIKVADAYWRFATFDVRAQAAIETFQKALAGNSMLYAIGIEEGYIQAAKEGLTGKEQWSFAAEWAKAKVDYFTHDAIVNGKTITGAINSHPTALKFGRMLTFTDDIRARMENRSFSFGQELARESGIDPNDFDAINKFALEYVKGTADVKGAKGFLNNKLSFLRGGDKSIPLAGEKTPALTGVWSYLPSIWARLQNEKWGWIATHIQPFVRSPAEIMKQAARAIPGLNLTVDTFYRDAFDESAFFSNHWKAELATGATAITVMMQILDNEDVQITGAGPLNNESKSLWEARGLRPMSIRYKFTGEDGVQRWSEFESYRAYEPVATLIRTIADYRELSVSMTHQERQNASALLIFNVAGEVMKGNLHATYYQGILDFLDGVVTPMTGSAWGQTGAGFGRPKRPGETTRTMRWLNKMIVSSFPHSSRVRALTQAIDPYKRTPSNVSGQVIDEEIGRGKEGMVWEWGGDGETIGGKYPYRTTFKLALIESFINEVKRNTPFWSETLPVRRNWVTGQPLYNAGFLHDDSLPLDDEPWLHRLTSAFTLTHAPIAYSAIPFVGALPKVTGRTGHEITAQQDYVMNELMRLRGFGTRYAPPSPEDIQAGTKLTTEGYDQYLKYLSQSPDPLSKMTLSQELFKIMNSKKYQNQPLEAEGDELTRSARAEMLRPVFAKFRKNAKWLFINDPNNPYVLEVLPTRATQVLKELDRDFAVKFGSKQTPPGEIQAGSKKRVSATEYIQSVQ